LIVRTGDGVGMDTCSSSSPATAVAAASSGQLFMMNLLVHSLMDDDAGLEIALESALVNQIQVLLPDCHTAESCCSGIVDWVKFASIKHALHNCKKWNKSLYLVRKRKRIALLYYFSVGLVFTFPFHFPPRTEDGSVPVVVPWCTVLYLRTCRSVPICRHVLAATSWFCWHCTAAAVR